MKEKMKNFIKKNGRGLKNITLMLTMAYLFVPQIVYASNAYTKPLVNLKNVLTTICAAAGVIILIFGGIRFAVAFQKMDQNGEHQAVYTMVAAGVLIGISAVVTALS